MNAGDVVVWADLHRGALTDITFELLSGARKLADAGGGKVIAAVMGDNATALAGALQAADEVLVVEQCDLPEFSPEQALSVLETLMDELQPLAVLVGSTSAGLDLGPSLAARRGLPVISGCKDVDWADGRLVATASFCGGKMLADLEVGVSPTVLLILPGSFPSAPSHGAGVIKQHAGSFGDSSGVTFQEMLLPDASDVDITQQDILLGVGRGVQQKDNIELLEELAEALGAQLCASRPVVDQGWLPATRQVGKSGMIVKPKCYFALGISGAPEHVEGMAESELIVAINTDPDAPIFETAHYGVVADMLDIAEALTEAAKIRVEAH